MKFSSDSIIFSFNRFNLENENIPASCFKIFIYFFEKYRKNQKVESNPVIKILKFEFINFAKISSNTFLDSMRFLNEKKILQTIKKQTNYNNSYEIILGDKMIEFINEYNQSYMNFQNKQPIIETNNDERINE